MNGFFVTLAAVCLSTAALAGETVPKERGKAPLMVSFTDLKFDFKPAAEGSPGR